MQPETTDDLPLHNVAESGPALSGDQLEDQELLSFLKAQNVENIQNFSSLENLQKFLDDNNYEAYLKQDEEVKRNLFA